MLDIFLFKFEKLLIDLINKRFIILGIGLQNRFAESFHHDPAAHYAQIDDRVTAVPFHQFFQGGQGD